MKPEEASGARRSAIGYRLSAIGYRTIFFARLGEVMPDGGARSATLERMTALSLPCVARGQTSCADHSGFMPVVDAYRLAV